MNNNDDRSKSFTRRAFVVGAFQGMALAVLGGRLAWLQVAQGGRYKTLSDKNRINIKMIAPSRGEIVDRYGVPLAVNNQNFRVLVVPEQTDDLEKSLQSLSKLIDLNDQKIKKVMEESKRSSAFVPLEVTDDLNWAEVSKIEVNLADLPGMAINEGERRSYPYGLPTGHVVGYVGAVYKKDLTGDPILTLPGFKIGKRGIEKKFDTSLRGAAGNKQMEVNVRGREVRELQEDESQNGNRLALSLDAELQRYVQQRLSEHKSASAVIMDSKTGAVYACASHPGFDPNQFAQGISVPQYEELANNPALPFNNKAVSGQYPPGSTFKMMTALAALEGGYAKPNTKVRCKGRYEFGKDKFHCWKLSGHGNQNVVTALMRSCDTWFYEMSTEVGIDNISAMARAFGLGQKYDFDLDQERGGLMPTKAWMEKRYNKSWRPGETIVSSIGQGYTLATPLQLAVMTSRLVNGGYAVKPWVVGYENSKKRFPDTWPKINVKQEHLDVIMAGMDKVVNDEDGTAHKSAIDEDLGFKMGGKTGTAQVKKINRKQYAQGIMNEDLDWKFRHHALFVGYAPVENPRYVVSVVVEHGGGGSAVAAPLAKDLMIEVQKRNPAATPMQHASLNEGENKHG